MSKRQSSRAKRQSQPQAEVLEQRGLLSHVAPRPQAPPAIEFGQPHYYASQFSTGVTISLVRSNVRGTSQAVLATVSTAEAGVDYQPVQTVIALPPGQASTTVTIPINPGAPSPGQVDVPLVLMPLNAPTSKPQVATLSIVDRADATPPQVASTRIVGRALVLTFTKPLDPAIASNVRNYLVTDVSAPDSSDYLKLVFLGKQIHTDTSVPLRAAIYDAPTHSVTLVPGIAIDGSRDFQVRSRFRGSHSGDRLMRHPAQALIDLEGNQINGSGVFGVPVSKDLWGPGRGG